MHDIHIQSLGSHPGNSGNFDREIIIGWGAPDCLLVKLTNHFQSGASATFNISREAAERLLCALDLLLSNGEDDG